MSFSSLGSSRAAPYILSITGLAPAALGLLPVEEPAHVDPIAITASILSDGSFSATSIRAPQTHSTNSLCAGLTALARENDEQADLLQDWLAGRPLDDFATWQVVDVFQVSREGFPAIVAGSHDADDILWDV